MNSVPQIAAFLLIGTAITHQSNCVADSSLSLDDCVEIAFQHQPALSVQRENVHLAQEQLAIAKSYYYPQVNAATSLTALDDSRSFTIDNLFAGNVGDVFTDAAAFFELSDQLGTNAALAALNSPNTPVFPGGPTFNDSKRIASSTLPQSIEVNVLGETFLNTQIDLVQPLWTAGRIGFRVDQSRYGIQIAHCAEIRTRQAIRLNVTRAYYSVLLSRHLMQVASKAAAEVTKTENLLQSLIDDGDLTATKSDLMKVRSAQRLLQSQLPRLTAAESRALAALKLAVGFQQETDLTIGPDQLEFTNRSFSDSDLLMVAVRSRPEVSQASAALQIAKLESKAAKAEFFPQVVGFAKMSTIHDDRSFPNPNDDIEWAGGVAATLNLSNGGRRKAAVRVASHQITKANAAIAQIQQLVEQETQDALIRFRQSKAALRINHDAYKSAEDSIRLLKLAEQTGMIANQGEKEHTQDKMTSILLFAKSGTDFYQSLFEYNLSLAELQFATGSNLTHGVPDVAEDYSGNDSSNSWHIDDGTIAR
ncbi:MAG: TolC family protein [Planctomycetales bacterium]|nr:TolC family protein [Planctomycetales bacterium]